MDESKPLDGESDPFDLNRFLEAQEENYDQALSEIQLGAKTSHWMWYIFPQFDGLGFSTMSRRYAIKSLAEAQAYLDHPVLGQRLQDCCNAVLRHSGRTAHEIFGSPDDLKFHSSITLFASTSGSGSVFERLIDQFFGGRCDQKTIRLINLASR